ELGWKQHGNTLYGVAASPHLATNNVVLANVVTATARALAFVLQLALNGFQVITDGCTYRRDQVSRGTLADCLAADPEYPVRRPDGGVPFHDPGAVPAEDDAAFTAWYRGRAKGFLQASGPDYDELFALHDLSHKGCGPEGKPAFDGLCCDGSA